MTATRIDLRTVCQPHDPWLNNGRWQIFLGQHLGVCVRCGQIVSATGPVVRTLSPEQIRYIAKYIPWMYAELANEQKWIRHSIVNVQPPPGVLERFSLDLERIA